MRPARRHPTRRHHRAPRRLRDCTARAARAARAAAGLASRCQTAVVELVVARAGARTTGRAPVSTNGTSRDTATGAGAGSPCQVAAAERAGPGAAARSARRRRAAGCPGRRPSTCRPGRRAPARRAGSAGSGPRPGRGRCPAAGSGRRRPHACGGIASRRAGSPARRVRHDAARRSSAHSLILVAVAACAWLAAGPLRVALPGPGGALAAGRQRGGPARHARPRRFLNPSTEPDAPRGADPPSEGATTKTAIALLRDVVRREPDNRFAWAGLAQALGPTDPAGARRALSQLRRLVPPVEDAAD